MASVLKISDGTTTVDFLAASAAYRVTEWTPAVANRRRDALGGRGPYDDVEEVMAISVKAYTYTAAENLNTLRALLLQAERWGNGDRTVAAVLLYYKIESDGTELMSTILGPSGDAPMVELPPGFVFSPQTDMIDGVVLRFRRLGVWLGAEDTSTYGTAQSMPVTQVLLGAFSTGIALPVKLSLAGINLQSNEILDAYALAVSNNAAGGTSTKIKILSSHLQFSTGAAPFSGVDESANNSGASTVLRYTPSTTGVVSSAIYSAANIHTSVRRWGAFFSYRNNSATTSFRVRMYMYGVGGGGGHTPWFEIPAGVGTPKFGYLGAVTIAGPLGFVYFEIQASAASGTCDIDLTVLMAQESPDTSRVIAIHSASDGITAVALSNEPLVIDHQLLSKPSPFVYFDDSGGDVIASYSGDAAIFCHESYIELMLLATGGDDPKYWTLTGSAGTPLTNKWSTISRAAYLIPE